MIIGCKKPIATAYSWKADQAMAIKGAGLKKLLREADSVMARLLG
jgi:hypothetical protein